MKPNIGVNLRVTGHCNQGSRKYMEDTFSVAYQQTKDGTDLEYAYFGIFDGHGGKEAAQHAKENLMDNIVSHPEFWSENDEDVTKAIREGFIHTHQMMLKEHYSWPKTATGLPSTSGTTASIAFVRNSKIYVGHVGDSGIVLGYQDPDKKRWRGRPLTRDHKPECAVETRRIQECGGKVIYKAGVPRVVWNRPRIGHKGPVRRSTQIDEIPFLAVARALGDFWSYNSELDQFVVSPDPDVHVYPIDITKDRCLVLGTDGLWNMLSSEDAVTIVWYAETMNEAQTKTRPTEKLTDWINPSKNLVDFALDKWLDNGFRADNCSVVTVLLDPPGPPKQPSTAIAASVQSAGNSPITSLTGLPSIDVLDGPLTSLEAIANRFISEEARNEERTPSSRGPMPTKNLPPQGSTCRVNSAKEKTVPLKSEVLKCRGDVKFGFMKKRRKHPDNEAEGGSSKKVATPVDSENDPTNVGRFSKETRPGAEFGPKENKRRRTASSSLDDTSGARSVARRSCEARELRSSFKRTLRQRNVDTFESPRLNRTRSHTWSQGGRNK